MGLSCKLGSSLCYALTTPACAAFKGCTFQIGQRLRSAE